MIQFDLPKEQSSILKVIGIGGGGGNAVNHMFSQKIEGVDFIICNTDAQALEHSNVPNKIQLGPNLTQGLGAGANPEIGKEATQESLEEIKRILEVNTKMAFITAGMGGGTGTGGAPIIAGICKELGILTVGIVTTPFGYEGKKRMAQAQEGIENLKENVDTLLLISNDKLRHQFGNLTMKAAFAKADNVLATAAKCITDVITTTGQINVDFADVCTVMRNGGVAILGSAACEGEGRAQKAIEQALNSPLLNDNDISGARWILININSAEGEHEFTMDEVEIIQTYLISKAGEGSDVILGWGYDNSLGENIGITLIATGFDDEESRKKKEAEAKTVPEIQKEVLELKPVEKKTVVQPLFLFDQQDEPAVPAPEPEKEIRVKGIQQEKVLEALKKEESNLMDESMKPKFSSPDMEQEERKKDCPCEEQIRDNVIETNDIVYFDLSPVAEEKKNILINPNGAEVGNKGDEKAKDNQETGASFSSKEAPVKTPRVYVERPSVPEEIPTENVPPLQSAKQEDEPAEQMHLVEKNSSIAAGDDGEQNVHQTMPVMKSDVEEPPMADEAEELKRKALDRIARLRNLSYNNNFSDPNNEFESVPAYLRRNMELHNSIANVENFYTNYSVKRDEENKIQISSLNTYLDGKKPD